MAARERNARAAMETKQKTIHLDDIKIKFEFTILGILESD